MLLLQELLSIKILQVGVINLKLQAITPIGIYPNLATDEIVSSGKIAVSLLPL